MKNLINQIASDLSQEPKTAVGVATMGMGVVTAIELIPVVVGVLASLAGFVYLIVQIYTTIKQHNLKMKLMQKELDDNSD